MALLDASAQLGGSFFVRFPMRLWTNRRYVNGIISLDESLMGDAKLEIVIEGVMDDIKIWLDANQLSYDSWTDITLVPRAIRRAATYGVAESLYSRRTRTFQTRVIPTVAPVKPVVIGDEERAMNYWQGRKDQMLELYLTASGSSRMWVSTEDEEPIFSMEDIPPETDEYTSWHEWAAQR